MFSVQGSIFTDEGANTTIQINSSDMSAEEIEQGGFFTSGLDFSRFIFFVGFGIGLTSDTPTFISLIWIVIASGITLFSIGFVIDSIWSG